MAVFRTTHYTVECRNNTFQYNMRLNKALDCLTQNLHQSFHSQKTAHSSPTKVSCVVFLVQNKGNIDRVKTASHFILILPIQVRRLGPFSIYFYLIIWAVQASDKRTNCEMSAISGRFMFGPKKVCYQLRQTVICWFSNLSPLIKHCSFNLSFQQHIQYGTIYVY